MEFELITTTWLYESAWALPLDHKILNKIVPDAKFYT